MLSDGPGLVPAGWELTFFWPTIEKRNVWQPGSRNRKLWEAAGGRSVILPQSCFSQPLTARRPGGEDESLFSA